MQKTAELKVLPVSVLKPAEYNPRKKLKPGDKEYEKIKNSITEFGYVDPVIVNDDMTVIGGHQRLTVLKDLGFEEIDCVVISVDIKRVDGEFRVFAKGGREDTGIEAIGWIKRCVENGAGEVVVNSIDTDGVKKGFDIEMLKAVCDVVNVPVIASGGAGGKQDFVDLFNTVPNVSAGLAASIFHYGEVTIDDLKKTLNENNITVRL